MLMVDALAVQRALAKVPEVERVVLAVLYIPNRLPAVVRLAKMRVPPLLSRERHIRGLRMFYNIWLRTERKCGRVGLSETVSALRLAAWQAGATAKRGSQHAGLCRFWRAILQPPPFSVTRGSSRHLFARNGQGKRQLR